MFGYHNSVTNKKLNLGKIIVLSPQPDDIGKLIEKQNYSNRRKIKLMGENQFGNQLLGSSG